MSVAEHPGYQLTPLGWLPLDWEVQRLSALTKSYAGGTPDRSKSDYFEGDIPWVKSGEVNLRKITKTEEHISEIALSKSSAKLAESGSVLVAMYGATAGKVARLKIDAAINQAVLSIRSVGDAIDNDFLFWVMESSAEKLLSMCQGAAQPNLSKGLIDGLEVATPPLPEQQKIAAILTAADDKLDVIARQIEATQTLKQGLMQALFSRGVGTQDADGRWVPHAEFKDSELGEIPAGWTVAPLGELIEKLMDFRGRTPKKLGMDWGGGDIPALSANNVRMGYIDFDRECYLGSNELYAAWMVQGDTRKNDLVFTMEAPLGNVAVIPDDRKYILSQRVVLLRTNPRAKYSYLFQYLRSDTFGRILEANSTGTTAKGIQQKRLVQLPVVVPPVAEQERIADLLGVIDGKLASLLSKQSHHQTLKRGLMQKLLTGEWRVNVDASATGT